MGAWTRVPRAFVELFRGYALFLGTTDSMARPIACTASSRSGAKIQAESRRYWDTWGVVNSNSFDNKPNYNGTTRLRATRVPIGPSRRTRNCQFAPFNVDPIRLCTAGRFREWDRSNFWRNCVADNTISIVHYRNPVLSFSISRL